MNLQQLSRQFAQFFFRTPRPDDLVKRIEAYRGEGSKDFGIYVQFLGGIDDLDYALMAADNSTAHINSGTSDYSIGEWFNIKPGALEGKSFGNSHGSYNSKGKEITESAYMSIPKPEYRADPKEVVWHHLRVTELRSRDVPQEERVRIMNVERRAEPWLKQ